MNEEFFTTTPTVSTPPLHPPNMPAMLVFPIMNDGETYLLRSIPVTNDQDGYTFCRRMEMKPDFIMWARSPYDGTTNITVDEADLKEAVQKWMANMKATAPH